MAVEQGNRVVYDHTTLLALAGSPISRAPPVKMAFVPGVTRTPNQCDIVMAFRKSQDKKKQKEQKKKTFNPFDLLADDE